MSSKTTLCNIPLNRVEGDLKLKVAIEDGTVTDAWSCGIMYRGFENLLKGRAPKDSLVLTPRVCGICSTAHLLAAAKALDMICRVSIPNNALIVRNITSMTEHLQSDMRHGFLMFMGDFINDAYRHASFYPEAVERYRPFKGKSILQAVKITKDIIEIIAIVGGQWPHSSFMVPGGIAGILTQNDVISSRYLLARFRSWYEKKVLGCTIDRWLSISSLDDLNNWFDESENHRQSEIGFFMHACRETGLDKLGRGVERFVSYGQFEFPEAASSQDMLFPPGFYSQNDLEEFNQENISEHVSYSLYEDYPGGLHPSAGKTTPVTEDEENIKYSYAKAPRYNDLPAETGPLAEMICRRNPLFTDLIKIQGASVFSRQLARFARASIILPEMERLLDCIDLSAPFYNPVPYIPEGKGYGLTGGCRGALGHWVSVREGLIDHYQIITPTSWNGSPRDSNHARGPWEEAVLGAKVEDSGNPVNIGHIIRSFDACQVCSVHAVTKKR